MVNFRRQKGSACRKVWKTPIWTIRSSNTGKGMRFFSSVNRPYRPCGTPACYSMRTVVISRAVKGLGFDKPLTPSSAEVKNARSYTSTSPYLSSSEEIGKFIPLPLVHFFSDADGPCMVSGEFNEEQIWPWASHYSIPNINR